VQSHKLATSRYYRRRSPWPSKNGQHTVAIAGVLDDMLLICDPIYGDSGIQYESFPTAYQGGARLVSVCLTKQAFIVGL